MSHISTMETSKLKQLLQPIKGVILDIDGTLTVPGLINYKNIREKANVPIGQDIFPYIRSHYKGEEYDRAMKVVEEEELKAQQKVALQKDANKLLQLLNDKGIKVALLTRNSRPSMEHTMTLFTAKVDCAYCRDFQPSKPFLDPFLKICEDWNIQPNEILLAGDNLDDFIASVALKSVSCYVRPQYNNSSHVPVLKSTDGLSLENCQHELPYLEEYKKNNSRYTPDLVVDCISELYNAWKAL